MTALANGPSLAPAPAPAPARTHRPEIDGLRAIAVLSVVAFHVEVPWLQGGFVGVDVFFVISGFLITRILRDELERTGTLGFTAFYARRMKRLLPAALVMLLATLAAGALLLSPAAYMDLAASAVCAAAFGANVWFATHAGYFDPATAVSPLVHTWSLAVEEQFYLLYPPLLWLTHRLAGARGMRAAIVGTFLGSLGLSVLDSANSPTFSFYLLPARAWELSLGALLTFLPARVVRARMLADGMAWLGLALIGLALFVVSEDQPYPGTIALLPTLATALLLVGAEAPEGTAHRVLSLPAMRWIGECSYSIYLWHWPIVVLYRVYVSERAFDGVEVALLFAASLAAGALSWRVVEQRWRYARTTPATTLRYAACGIVATMAAGGGVYAADGFPARVPPQLQRLTSHDAMWAWECPATMRAFAGGQVPYCVVGADWARARQRGVVWGDSHSAHWAPLLHRVAARHDTALVIAHTGCAPYLDARMVLERAPLAPNYSQMCARRRAAMLAWLDMHPEVRTIVLAAAWSGHAYLALAPSEGAATAHLPEHTGHTGADSARGQLVANALRHTLDAIDLRGRRVLLLGDVPRPNRRLTDCAFTEGSWMLRAQCTRDARGLDAAEVRAWHGESERALRRAAELQPRTITFASAVERLCGRTTCPTFIAGELIYMDDNHLRRDLASRTQEALIARLRLDAWFASEGRRAAAGHPPGISASAVHAPRAGARTD